MSENALINEEQAETAAPATMVLPLDAWHRARGARMVEFAGYHMPIQYDGIMAEHLWTRANAGLFDVSHMGQIRLSGKGVAAALETLVPGDIQVLKPGRMRYSLLLADDGGILDDMMVTATDYGLYLVVNGAVKHDDIAYLLDTLPDEVTINVMDEHALLALQGPAAVAALARLIPGVTTLVFMQAGAFRYRDMDLWISRSGYTGEDGFEISVAADRADDLATDLCAQPEVKPIGLGARDSLRLEAGLPLYGHDLNPGIDPVEADLGFAVSKRRRLEGGFAGVGRILANLGGGPATQRVGFKVAGRQPVREGAAIYMGDQQVGIVTSGGFAPSIGAPIAMGYIKAMLKAEGTPVEADVRGKRVPMTVTAMPFVPHNYVRKGG